MEEHQLLQALPSHTLNIHMPGMNGFEVCRHIRHTSDARVIFHSSTSTGLTVSPEEFGADSFLTHPINPNHLVASIKASIAKKDCVKGVGR
jgi:two-component system response regulator MtrA